MKELKILICLILFPQMADSLLPAPASITSPECDCKWVRRPMGGSVIRLDIPRDAVSVACHIKSTRGHTRIRMTPWVVMPNIGGGMMTPISPVSRQAI